MSTIQIQIQIRDKDCPQTSTDAVLSAVKRCKIQSLPRQQKAQTYILLREAIPHAPVAPKGGGPGPPPGPGPQIKDSFPVLVTKPVTSQA